MHPFKSFVFATLMLLAVPVTAQVGPMQAESAPAVAAAPEVPEIAPAPAAKGDCKQCKQGGKMAHGDMGSMQHGMACCKGMQGAAAKGGCDTCKQGGMGRMTHGGGSAALEQRVDELEKRLAQVQEQLRASGSSRN